MSKVSSLWDEVLSASGVRRIRPLKKLHEHLWKQGNSVESIATLQELRELQWELGEIRDWLHNSWLVALRYQAQNSIDEALTVVADALPESDLASDYFNKGYLLMLRGSLLSQRRQAQDSAAAYLDAASAFGSQNFIELEGEARTNAARQFFSLFETEKSQEQYEMAASCFREVKNTEKLLTTQLCLSDLLNESGRHTEVVGMLQELLPVAWWLKSPASRQKIIRRLGDAHSRCGDWNLAESLLKEAVEMRADRTQLDEALKAMENLAEHNRRAGELKKAESQFWELECIKKTLGVDNSERQNREF